MSQPGGKVALYDGDGVLITVLELDANGEAQYTFQLDNEDVGRNQLRAVYTGDNQYAPLAEDTFVLEVVDENGEGGTKSKATNVTKIIAGPGIYISPTNGKGDVTISTRPISDAGNENFTRVRWVQTIGNETKFNTDLSMFIGCGGDGLVMTSDDAQSWVNTGPVNKVGVGNTTVSFDNIHPLQKADYPGEGIIYFNIQEGTFSDGGVEEDYISVIWGNLGYTDPSGIYKGDNIDKQSTAITQIGLSNISGQNVGYAETFVVGNDILTLIFSEEGRIWSVDQLATDFETTYSGSPSLEIMRLEATGIGNVQSCWSDKDRFGTGSFRIKAVTTQGDVLTSVRSSNGQSTWSVEYNGSAQLNGIGYNSDDNTWIAVGNSNTVLRNTGGGSTWTNIAPANGTNWFGAAYGNGKWVIVGANGAIATSTNDGNTWQLSSSGNSYDLFDVAYSPKLNVFAAVGERRSTVAITGF